MMKSFYSKLLPLPISSPSPSQTNLPLDPAPPTRHLLIDLATNNGAHQDTHGLTEAYANTILATDAKLKDVAYSFNLLRRQAPTENKSKFQMQISQNRPGSLQCEFRLKGNLTPLRTFNIEREDDKQDLLKSYIEYSGLSTHDTTEQHEVDDAIENFVNAVFCESPKMEDAINKFNDFVSRIAPENRSKFQMEISRNNWNNLQCQLNLKCNSLRGNGHIELCTFNHIADAADKNSLLKNYAKYLGIQITADMESASQSAKNKGEIDPFSLENYTQANFQCMFDERELQNNSHLHNNPFYCHTNFVKNEDVNPHLGQLFEASFANKGNTKKLLFSNRLATNNEFRSRRLKAALESGPYSTLYELASTGHLTVEDAQLNYVTTPVRLEKYLPLIEGKTPILDEDLRTTLDKELKHARVGNTSLAQLWNLAN